MQEFKLKMPIEDNPYYKDNPEYFVKLLCLVREYPRSYFNMLRRDGVYYTSNGKKRYRKYNPAKDRRYLLIWINNSIPLLSNSRYRLSTKCYWILNGLTDFPKCQHCHKSYNYVEKNVDVFNGYRTYCCVRCSSLDPIVQNKTANTCMKEYGVANYSQTSEYLEKQAKTKLKRHGNSKFVNVEKRGATNLKKYGNVCSLHSPIIDELMKANRNAITRSIIETKRKNGTFNTSKQENKAYELLLKVFPDLIRQYKSVEYPFACDFYSPAFDLYIEFNGTWTHGGHWYDKQSDTDIEMLKKWQAKNTKYYNNAIQTWTVRDVLKLKVARENNLNYIVFWCISEVKQYVDEFLSKFVNDTSK